MEDSFVPAPSVSDDKSKQTPGIDISQLSQEIQSEINNTIDLYEITSSNLLKFCRNEEKEFTISIMNKKNFDKYQSIINIHSFDDVSRTYTKIMTSETCIIQLYNCFVKFNKESFLKHSYQMSHNGITFEIRLQYPGLPTIYFEKKFNKIDYDKTDVVLEKESANSENIELLKTQLINESGKITSLATLCGTLTNKISALSDNVAALLAKLTIKDQEIANLTAKITELEGKIPKPAA